MAIKKRMVYDSSGGLALPFGIEVWRSGKDRFEVHYGAQVKDGLTREQASSELGNCLFHAFACDGRLD
jgi:hypothetical protein